MDSNHCEIVKNSLDGQGVVDEQTFASIAVLRERLERLKKVSESFSDIKFSSAVEKLTRHEVPVGV